MIINFLRVIIFASLISSVGYSSDLKFTLEKPIPFIGGSDYNKDNLQKSGLVKVEQFAGYFYLGEDKGFYFGLVSSKERAQYTQFETSSRPYGHFSSNYLNIGPEFGVWVQPSDMARLEGGITFSQGAFDISDEITSIANISNTRKVDVHVSYAYPSNILSPVVSLDLFVKLGYYKVFLSEFTYNGVNYSAPELNLKSYIYLSFGLGLRF